MGTKALLTMTLLAQLAAAAAAAAQGNPAQSAWAAERDRLERKTRRDEALKLLGGGEEAEAFLRFYGDAASRAVLHHQFRTPWRGVDADGPGALVAFWRSGRLEALPDPKAAVELVARHGPALQVWMITHHEKLCDPTAFEAFRGESLEYVYGLKDLGQGTEEVRARQSAAASPLTKLRGLPWQNWAAAGLVAAALLAYARERRRKREGGR